MRGGASESVSELCIPESECSSGSVDLHSVLDMYAEAENILS